jgi:glycopeptide antibiotics resistance protein
VDVQLSVRAGYRWALTLTFVAFIVGLSITPGVERPDDDLFSWLYTNTAPITQNVLHVVTYALLGALWVWTLAGIRSLPARIAVSVTLAMGLGIALEWVQTTVPGRYGTITDVLLNSLGVALGIVAALFLL